MPLHLSQPDDARHAGDVALAVKHVQEQFFHVGLLYRDENKNLRLLHFAGHYDLKDESPKAEYAWIEIWSLDPLTAQRAATVCRRVSEKYRAPHPGFAYSFASAPEFSDDFSLTDTSQGSGFTCVTFVMAVLKSRGIFLIDADTWQERPEDEGWRAFWIESLTKAGDANHAEMMKKKPRVFRFQPLDLIAAAEINHVASFSEVEAVIPNLRERLAN